MTAKTELSRAGFEGPVVKVEDDRYGFTAIADGLARSICELDENISTVIGIEGKWGTGKTSLLNLLTDQLRLQVPDTTEIVPFSPWLISPDESPVTSLLLTIAGRLAKYDTAAQEDVRSMKSLAGTLVNYAQQTSRRLAPVARLAGKLGVPGSEIAANVMEAVADTDLHRRQKTAAELRAELEDKITALGISFIIVIDDLDRLEPAQAVEILRMVRSVADFSRFRYVMCYDREVLAHAVERGYPFIIYMDGSGLENSTVHAHVIVMLDGEYIDLTLDQFKEYSNYVVSEPIESGGPIGTLLRKIGEIEGAIETRPINISSSNAFGEDMYAWLCDTADEIFVEEKRQSCQQEMPAIRRKIIIGYAGHN